MQATSLQSTAEVGKDQSEQSNSGIEMRFPDTALREIFSYLEFNDIASCRIVSKQWHQFALDNFSFVLSLQRDDSTRRSQRIAASTAAADNAHNWHVRMTLIPYPAWLDWKAAEKKALVTGVRDNPAQTMRLDQAATAIKKSFQRKIKHVVAKNMKSTILSILPALPTMAPAAAMIGAVNNGRTTRFVREGQAGNFNCTELDIDSVFDGDVAAASRLIFDNASFIVSLSAMDWRSVRAAINEIEQSDNNNSDLVFDKCEELLIGDAPCNIANACRSIVEHFPALRRLEYATSQIDSVANIKRLERLTNLTSLAIYNDSPSPAAKVLSKLRLPSLVDLYLGNNILLPEDQMDLFLPALTILQLETDFKNAWRLSTFGVPVLCNLIVLAMRKLPLVHVKPFLRSILPVAYKLESLTIDLLLTNILTDIYDTLLVVPTCKAALSIGAFEIFANAVDCRSLVQQRVADIKQRSLKTAITVVFRDNANSALVKTLRRAGAGGQGVAISAIADDAGTRNYKLFELKWRNDVADIRIQQKLKIGVWSHNA